jgi:hypothetical protein
MGLTREPDRFPGPLFPFSLGVLAACGVGDKTKNGNTKDVLVGRRIWTVATERATRLRQNQAGRSLQIYHLSFPNLSPCSQTVGALDLRPLAVVMANADGFRHVCLDEISTGCAGRAKGVRAHPPAHPRGAA